MNSEFAACVAKAVELLATGRFEELVELAPTARVEARDIERVVREYGRTLLPIPAEDFTFVLGYPEPERVDPDVSVIFDAGDQSAPSLSPKANHVFVYRNERERAIYHADVELRTVEEGRSDLSLTLLLFPKSDGSYRVEVRDLLVQ